MEWGKDPISGYLVDLANNERLEFQYNPSTISDSKSTEYATIKIPGMSHPRYQYVSGGPRQINFKLELFMKEVKKNVDWIWALQYPEHEGTMLKNAPHRVLLVVGDLYSGIECVVKQVRVQYFGLFDPASLLPQRADVDLSLEEFVNESVSWKGFRK